MRKCDEIKQLKHELGRYSKKVEEQAQQLSQMKRQVEGALQVAAQVDAMLAQLALHYGIRAADPDTGEQLGWRLELPLYSVEETMAKYEVRAMRDEEAGLYSIGVMEREK